MEIIKCILFWPFLPKKLRSERSKRFKLILGVLKILVIFPVFYLVSGCNFYKVTTSAYPQSGEIASLVGNKRSFVIHSGPEVFMADIIQVKTDSIQTNYIAEYTMPFEQDSFPAANSTNRYRWTKSISISNHPAQFRITSDLLRWMIFTVWIFTILILDKPFCHGLSVVR